MLKIMLAPVIVIRNVRAAFRRPSSIYTVVSWEGSFVRLQGLGIRAELLGEDCLCSSELDFG